MIRSLFDVLTDSMRLLTEPLHSRNGRCAKAICYGGSLFFLYNLTFCQRLHLKPKGKESSPKRTIANTSAQLFA